MGRVKRGGLGGRLKVPCMLPMSACISSGLRSKAGLRPRIPLLMGAREFCRTQWPNVQRRSLSNLPCFHELVDLASKRPKHKAHGSDGLPGCIWPGFPQQMVTMFSLCS
eukprot:1113048-Alexandrium_andersonii.AAC.2